MANIHLPDDIIHEILSRSSVKTLARLTLVCKFFRNLIKSDPFAYSHLRRATHHVHVVIHDWEKDQENFIMEYKEKKIANPLNLERSISLVGSCNGIICFCSNNNIVYFWNPSLHQIRSSVLYDDVSCTELVGFGYDHKSQDHKVVVIIDFSTFSRVQTYSLKNDSWKSFTCDRRISDFIICETEIPLEFNRSLHWITHIADFDSNGFMKYNRHLNTFRFSDDSFSEFVLPEFASLVCEYSLGVFKGCVSLLRAKVLEYEIWSMSNNGSWLKTYQLADGWPRGTITRQSHVQLTSNGKLLIMCMRERCITLYDPETNRSEVLESGVKLAGRSVYSIDYVESLISVNPLSPQSETALIEDS